MKPIGKQSPRWLTSWLKSIKRYIISSKLPRMADKNKSGRLINLP
jgi:hypothetical protein